MKLWQQKAIEKGRTPLPAYPGDKLSSTSDPIPHINQSYRFWTESDLRRLIEMRNGGEEWVAIAAAFPDRTMESVKQTFHKRRHAVEKRMAEDRADTTS